LFLGRGGDRRGADDFRSKNPTSEAFTVRAFADEWRKSFVLSRINAPAIRAFADEWRRKRPLDSCYRG
jgi:hypothetical protein